MRALDADFVASYASSPPASTVERAISLHENVRALLGDSDYVTFLQGSYKNDTALADMNDVDVVAVSTTARPGFWGYDWKAVFKDVEQRLEQTPYYRGKWKRHDKCITLNTQVSIDIVPAVPVETPAKDPIQIYSFSEESTRKNWPRDHYKNAAEKSRRTNNAFKQSVRLFKRWAKCHFPDERKVAPSYYLECLLHSLPDALFSGDLAADFVSLGEDIGRRYGGFFGESSLMRIAGRGDLLTSNEWASENFQKFRSHLAASVEHSKRALGEARPERAKAAWRMAFGGYNG